MEKLEPFCTDNENVNCAATIKKIRWKCLKNFRIELPHRCNYSIFGIYLKNTKDINLKRYMHPYVFPTSLFTIAKTWKQN